VLVLFVGFEKGCSDSVEYKLDDNPTSFLEISGLNFIRGVLCPHFNVERAREEGLENIVKNNFKYWASS